MIPMNTNNNYKLLCAGLLIVILASFVMFVFVSVTNAAEGYTITTSLPGSQTIVKGKAVKDNITIQDYIKELYLFALGIVGFVALAAISFHAFRYILAAGNAGKMGDALGGVWDAVLGLVLLLLAATILLFINPELVTLKSFDRYLPAISGPQVAPALPKPQWIPKNTPGVGGITSCSQIVGYIPATGCDPASEPAPKGNNLCCIKQ